MVHRQCHWRSIGVCAVTVCGCVGGVLQEQALKYVKRSYVRGDKQKLEDFTTALDALKQVG